MLELNQHNGQIYDVQTGKTVAIMLDKADPTIATLFAAAPELLKALEAMASLCGGDLLGICGTQTVNGQRIKARLEQARAAIAKATGETAVLSPARFTREELVQILLDSWEMQQGKMSPLTKWLVEDTIDALTEKGVI